MNQLSQQFWVTKAQVKANGYDLTASRYRQVGQDEAYYEKPQVTMERLLALETIMTAEVQLCRSWSSEVGYATKPSWK